MGSSGYSDVFLFQFSRAVGSQLGSSGYGDVPRQYGAPPHSLRQTMMLSSTSSQNRQWVRDVIFKNYLSGGYLMVVISKIRGISAMDCM